MKHNNMTNGNEPINTVVEHTDGSTMRLSCTEIGLTKREYFAAMALQGLMANPIHSQKWSFTFIERLKDMFGLKATVRASHAQNLTALAVKEADALINALNETK